MAPLSLWERNGVGRGRPGIWLNSSEWAPPTSTRPFFRQKEIFWPEAVDGRAPASAWRYNWASVRPSPSRMSRSLYVL